MENISIHQFLSCVDLRQIAFIESLSCEIHAEVTSEDQATCSAIAFIGTARLLTAQPLDYFRALAHGRVLDLGDEQEANALHSAARIVPLKAIHHLELAASNDLDAASTAVDADSIGEARIVYRAYDPAAPERRFQMPMPAAVISDLLDSEEPVLVDIGRGKFVFAEKIEDASPSYSVEVRFALADVAQGIELA